MPIEFYAAAEGYMEKEKDSAMIIRFASYRIAESMVGTKALGNIDKFWPIGTVDNKEVEPMTPERIEAIFKRHNIRRDGRSTNKDNGRGRHESVERRVDQSAE